MKAYIFALMCCLVFAGCTAGRGGGTRNVGSRNVQLQLTLAESYIKNRQPQQALQELMRLESQAEDLSRYHFDLGMAYLALEELELSLSGFSRAAEIDEDFGEAWNNKGKVLEALGRSDEAEQAYLRAFSILTYLTPEFPAYNLAAMYLKRGRLEESEDYARKALARNWRYLPAYKLLADVLVAQNRNGEAEDVLRSGVEADLDSPALILALAELQVRLGASGEARVLFKRIVDQYPKSDEAKVARDYLGIL